MTNLVEIKITVDDGGAAAKLAALKGETDAVAKSVNDAGTSAQASGSQFGGMLTPMTGLIAAGVALSPVIVTLGLGLGALGLAAFGMRKSIIAGSGAFQQLKTDYTAFQKALQPTVIADFNAAIGAAEPLLKGLEPVAKATGSALAGMFNAVGNEFRSGEWQQFFSFMAQTAGQDVQVLTRNFVDLLRALPPLLQTLQPVAMDLLNISDAALKVVGALAKVAQSASQTGQHMSTLEHVTSLLRTLLFSPGAGLAAALKLLHLSGNDAAKGMETAAQKAAILKQQVAALANSVLQLAGNILTLQGDTLSWHQAMQAADKQIESNRAGLAGYSANAIANKQALLQSTQAAISYANQQVTLKNNVEGAIHTLQSQISFLKQTAGSSAFARAEINALQNAINALQSKTVTITTNFVTTGAWAAGNPFQPGGSLSRRESGGIVGAASGKITSGMTLVGERGPELVKLPTGSHVFSNPDTQRMMGSGSSQAQHIVLEVAGDSQIASALRYILRNHVRTQYGGNVNLALGN